ncbi:YIP1 family protein [Rubrobacter marinus]|uniref:YIP1 family protein n=1 Tax=Rubrobacter marinus TaxID=2653852 RepID=UPI00140CD12E|nr:YIP1 family protein [Rubrobacter marinus]
MSAPSSKNATEFDPGRPVGSFLEVLRGLFFAPKRFFVEFSAEGPLREPILFVLLVSAVSAVVRLALVAVFGVSFGDLDAGDMGASALQALLYVAFSPVLVGLFAAVYLLSLRTFMGNTGDYRQVYRLISYVYGALILLPLPVVNAFAFTYAMLVLVAVGVRYVYRASFLTALLTALVGYVPAALLFLTLTVYVTGLVFGR